MANVPPKILFFDSGMGGLSVLSEVYKLNPHCAYYYLFDHECFPYGNKSEVFLRDRVAKLLEKIDFQIDADLIVIACNTASTTVLPKLREHFAKPIVGVVPAIKPASKLSQKKHIALLATPGTVQRAYTDFLINEFAYDCKVLKIGSEALVRLAENSLIQTTMRYVQDPSQLAPFSQRVQELLVDVDCDMEELAQILSPITSLASCEQPDIVILGCTHFPLLKAKIQQILGDHISLVDSGAAIGRRVQSLLSLVGDNDQIAPSTSLSEVCGPQQAFFTGEVGEVEWRNFVANFSYFGFSQIAPLYLRKDTIAI